MDLISNEDGDELGDSCKKQISMKCFLILGFTIRNAETILEMIDRFFNIYTDLVSLWKKFCKLNNIKVFYDKILKS